jgi:hypothetical protein
LFEQQRRRARARSGEPLASTEVDRFGHAPPRAGMVSRQDEACQAQRSYRSG